MDDLVNDCSKSLGESNASAMLHALDFIAAMFLQDRAQGVEDYLSMSTTQPSERILQGVENFLAHLSRLNAHLFALLSSNTRTAEVLVSA